MTDKKRYIVVVDNSDNSESLKKYLSNEGIDISVWKNFPCLLSAKLSIEQFRYLKGHDNIIEIEENNTLYLHEFVSTKIVCTDPNHAILVRNELIKQFDVVVMQYDDDNIVYVDLNNDQHDLIANSIVPPFDSALISYENYKNDQFYRVRDESSYNWGLERIVHRNTKLYDNIRQTNAGANVNIFIVDGGILPNHQELVGRVSTTYVYDAFRDLSDPYYGYPDELVKLSNGNYIVDDHGTHVASIAAGVNVGVAYQSEIIPVRILSNFYESNLTHLIDAIDWVIDTHQSIGTASVVNLSFSLESSGDESLVFETLIGSMINLGMTVVTSAGNHSTDAFFKIPANVGTSREIQNGNRLVTLYNNLTKPIVVGASDKVFANPNRYDIIWENSNFGDVIDIFAPGARIFAASLSYDIDRTNYDIAKIYTVKSGTSMAAPHVSGIAALHLSKNPNLTHQQIRELIVNQATSEIFNRHSVEHDRVDHDHYDSNGDKINLINPKVISPNKLAYIWYVQTFLTWDDYDDLIFDENTRSFYEMNVNSSDYYGDPQKVTYELIPLDIPPELVSMSIIQSTIYEQLEQIDQLKVGIYKANLTITTPLVTDDVIAKYIIKADDGRIKSFKGLNVSVLNVPGPPVWQSPSEGALLSTTVKKGQVLSELDFEFVATHPDNLPITYSIIPTVDAIPRGLKLVNNTSTQTAYIDGQITIIPNNQQYTLYEFIIRATDSEGKVADRYFTLTGEYVNEHHYFTPIWLSSLFEFDSATYPCLDLNDKSTCILRLPDAGIGNSYSTIFEIINPDSDPLTFTIEPILEVSVGPDVFNGKLPTGLVIDELGRLRGVVDPAETLGDYYFKLVVTDPHGYSISQKFAFRLREVESSISDGNQIIWVTPSGNIGHIYETSPCHCSVLAKGSDGTTVEYYVLPGRGVIPEGLELDAKTGHIVGLAPFVDGDTTYNFTIRARNGSRFVDRDFSITILNAYNDEKIMNIRANITGFERMNIGKWTWATENIPHDKVFRLKDSYYGLPINPSIYIIDGLNDATDAKIMDYLNDYHYRMDLRYGAVKSQKVIDPSGIHAYDVVYQEVIDPQIKSGGFDEDNVEMTLLELQKNTFDQNNYDPITMETRYYPNSINNVRQDFIQTDGRDAPGLSGDENQPLWMRAIGNFTLGVILAYVKPDEGLRIANLLERNGINDDFSGRIVTVDRYYIAHLESKITTQFDVVNDIPTTQFDSPNRPNELYDQLGLLYEDFSVYTQPTQFDVLSVETGKYYKFPLDDRKILDDRDSNLHK